MTLEQARELARNLIVSGDTHQDYETVTELSKKLRALITGKGIEKLLRRVTSREDEAQFAQRVELTKSITPAIASSVRIPFNRVAKNNRITRKVELANPEHTKQLEEMIRTFYGGKRRKNKGLEGWLRSRFMDLSFTDPNAWVVMEWDQILSPTDAVNCRPFEVSCFMAKNFKVVNGETKWLFVEQNVKMKTLDGANVKTVDGVRFTLYEDEYSIVYEKIDKDYLKSINYSLRAGQEYETFGDVDYLYEYYEHKIGFVPAVRVGYKTDLSTSGRTFVNQFDDGMCFFDKSIKSNSEFDLTLALHTFPQKLQYVDECKGTARKKCNGGYVTGSSTVCSVCKGSGYAIHTSSSDVIYRKMPKTKDDMIDLDKTLIYKAPPIDLIKFQNDYLLQLKSEVHSAVFNSQVFIKKTSSASGNTGGEKTQTATENENDMQSVNEAIHPFTEHFSEVFKDFVIMMAATMGENIDEVEVEYIFPLDPKLKTLSMLLSELKNANDSGAPSFLKDSITNDIAEVINAGDKLGLLKIKIKRKFFPFNGKDTDEIAVLMGSQYVPNRSKILYANYEMIFSDLEMENPGFFLITNPKKQKELIDAKIEEYKEQLDIGGGLEATAAIRAALLKESDSDPNPGNNDTDPQNTETEDPID